MIVVDTTVWIDFLGGRGTPFDRHLDATPESWLAQRRRKEAGHPDSPRQQYTEYFRFCASVA
jgi:hypothetical protein